MKSFFWRTVFVLLPCFLAAWVTWVAVTKYFAGEPGGFKLGVDLVGGTILVYEIDLRKQEATAQQAGETTQRSFDPVKDINVLAEALKRRIDPNDQHNIVIRPAGSEGRIEIVLPTGGTYRSEKAEEDWRQLIAGLEEKYDVKDPNEIKMLQVPRGKIFELANAIQIIKGQNRWSKDLLNNRPAWDRMIKFVEEAKDEAEAKKLARENTQDPESAEYYFGQGLINAFTKGDTFDPTPLRGLWQEGKALDVDKLVDSIYQAMKRSKIPTKSEMIKTWIKGHAWHQLEMKALEKWPALKEFKLPKAKAADPDRHVIQRITADNNEQLAGYILSGGSFVGQAGLFAMESIIGANPLEGYEDPDAANGLPKYDEVIKFIEENYGPSHRSILQEIRSRSKRGTDLTVEDVQRIKEQVARVGYLEFRILANEKDDAEGIADAKKLLPSAEFPLPILKEDYAEKGLPPPAPRGANGKPKIYSITLARGQKSYVSYSWVELSRQQRKDLNLDNASRDDPSRSKVWNQAKKDQAFELKDNTEEKSYFNGALFYKRDCVDRNLSFEEQHEKKYEYFILTREPEYRQNEKGELTDAANPQTPRIDGSFLIHAEAKPAQDLRPAVSFAFNAAGARLFGDITSKNVPDESGSEATRKMRHLAIILDGQVMSAPTIQSTIRDSGQITGNFTQKEIDSLVNTLRAGTLPTTLKPDPVSEQTMGPTLGQDTIRAGVIALLSAFGAVLVFMVIYYRFAGLVASLALLANLLLTIGFMVAVQATFTLPGLAGLVLMLGMAVDANVLIYERVREERERGANLPLAIRHGYERALPTIIDTHLSSIFTAIVLYIVGNDQLKGFGISLTVGLIISLFTSLFMTRLMFDFWLAKGWLTKLSMLRFFARPSIDFMGIRKPMFIATVVLGLLGFALFFGRAPFNIDFVGGTKFGSSLTKPMSVEEMRDRVSEERQKERLKLDKVEEVDFFEQDASDSASTLAANPEGPAAKKAVRKVNRGTYNLYYADVLGNEEKKREVYLLNPPELGTKEEREQAVMDQAKELTDLTLEQQFRSFAKTEGNKSNFFVLRTTEKEPELVQAALDRLLRADSGESLLRRTHLRQDSSLKVDTDNAVKLDFYNGAFDPNKPTPAAGEKASGLPLMVKSLFGKELAKVYGTTDRTQLPAFEIQGEGAATKEGEYTKDDEYQSLTIKLEKIADKDVPKIKEAVEKTLRRFNDQIQPDDLENFDSTLATETRYRALWAILASWVAILVYLWFRFGNWTFGLAAVICLIHDLFITLGIIAAAHYLHGTFIGDLLGLEDFKVDLPAVAALLTLVGYSVNDTIVVFDRIKEVRGKNPDLTPKMINDSVNQTLSRTLLASLTTWLVVFVLYVWGGPGVKLFAFVMVIGVVVGTYSSIYIASPLLLWFGEGHKDKGKPGTRPVRPTPEGATG